MIEMGERYKNLYWAAKLSKWEFAQYQVEEMASLLERLQLTRPKRAATAQQFPDEAVPQMERAAGEPGVAGFRDGLQGLAGRLHALPQAE
jgi:hypothetical protein